MKLQIKLRRQPPTDDITSRSRFDSRYVAVTATNSQGFRPRDSSLRRAIASRIRKHTGAAQQRQREAEIIRPMPRNGNRSFGSNNTPDVPRLIMT